MSDVIPHGNAVHKAVFLDRDGTINVEKDYLHHIEDFEFIPGVPQALKKIQDAGFLLVVVTNQSGVARGYYTLDDVDVVHQYMRAKLLESGVKMDGIYVCPHHPTEGISSYRKSCNCRKGKPGMLLQAADDLNIDLTFSFMVGDKPADIQAGVNAGCRSLLVRTGYGQSVALSEDMQCEADFADLPAAVNYILQENIEI